MSTNTSFAPDQDALTSRCKPVMAPAAGEVEPKPAT